MLYLDNQLTRILWFAKHTQRQNLRITSIKSLTSKYIYRIIANGHFYLNLIRTITNIYTSTFLKYLRASATAELRLACRLSAIRHGDDRCGRDLRIPEFCGIPGTSVATSAIALDRQTSRFLIFKKIVYIQLVELHFKCTTCFNEFLSLLSFPLKINGAPASHKRQLFPLELGGNAGGSAPMSGMMLWMTPKIQQPQMAGMMPGYYNMPKMMMPKCNKFWGWVL